MQTFFLIAVTFCDSFVTPAIGSYKASKLPGNNAGGSPNIKLWSYQYMDSQYKDGTAVKPSYLYNGNRHTWEDWFVLKQGPVAYVATDVVRCLQKRKENRF